MPRAQKLKWWYAYVHCTPKHVPFYVGKGHNNRCYNFKGRNRNNEWHEVVNSFGGIKHLIVKTFHCGSEDEAHILEKYYIKLYRDTGYYLVNKTDGGEGSSGYQHTEESRLKIGLVSKNQIPYKRTPETLAKYRATRAGKPSPKKGKPGHKHSDDTKQRMSQTRSGRKHSPEHCANLSKSQKGKPRNPESIAKMTATRRAQCAAGLTNKPGPRKGNAWTPEFRATMEAANVARKLLKQREKGNI